MSITLTVEFQHIETLNYAVTQKKIYRTKKVNRYCIQRWWI